jgi:hypothetical protein
MTVNGRKLEKLGLGTMIFAVAMAFIDQAIVSIGVPQSQHGLGPSMWPL